MFTIGVVNRSKLPTSKIKEAVRAINKQLKNHFGPAWDIDAKCIVGNNAVDALMYIDDKSPQDDALGYHDYDAKKGIPDGYVFLDLVQDLGESWTVTLSHEILEITLNRFCRFYVFGVNPKNRRRQAIIWLEACDPVQDQTYEIDGVAVSDFVYPWYFTVEHEGHGQANNHLSEKPVTSFSVTAGGYVGFYDLERKQEDTYFADKRAEQRHLIKERAGRFRRKRRISLLIDGIDC